MKPIEFSKAEMRDMVRRLQGYFTDELEMDLGDLPAEMLIAFIARDLGPAFYNRGLYDAQALIAAKAEETVDAIYGMEQKPGGR
ncbi:MAG: DUF2164 domain-containing protein [Brevundimonas sp.]|uniref:DUF2164 domain-containing protein n=1 Tax=Brevundimonas sp. TaxID=1871086 RepID=UPI0040346D45